MYIKGNRNTLLWYIVFSIQWTLSIACFILLLQITYYTIPGQEKGEIFITGKERPLMDILQEQTEGTDKLSFGNWSGTIEGCLCNNGTIAKKTCRKANDTKCKEIIPPVSNITVYTWRGKSFYTTPSKYTYDDLFEISVDEKEECPFRYKKCGKLDYYNNTLCLPEDEKCPVNYLEITNSAEPPNKKFNFISIPFGDGYYIHYTNEDVDNYTIKNYFRSGDKIPCINFGDYNDTLPKYNLSAGHCYYRHNFIYASKYYSKVDSISKEQLLKENNKYDEVKNLTQYPYEELAVYNYSISTGIFLGYNRTCRNDVLNFNETINKTETTMKNVKHYNISLFALFSFFSFCVLPIFFIITEKQLNIFNYINIGIVMIIFIICIFSHSYANKNNILYSCFDPHFQSYLIEIQTQINYMQKFTLLYMYYCILYVVLFLIDIPYNIICHFVCDAKKSYHPVKNN